MEKNRLIILILLVAVLVSVGWMMSQKSSSINQEENGILATIYKSPYCGCCGAWEDHMERKGFTIETIPEENMSVIKEQFDIPAELESCHTTTIDGYVVEGHVPHEAVVRLLEERPDIKGIGMAGMPSGSPGMPGPKEDFMIYEINHDGTKGDLYMQL